MKVQDTVCTIPQAMRLKELGVSQTLSIFRWVTIMHNSNGESSGLLSIRGDTNRGVSTFSVAELGVMLSPDYYSAQNEYGWYMCIWENNGDGIGEWVNMSNRSELFEKEFDTEAQARAAMLIYLLQNNHIDPDTCNARLNEEAPA